MSHRLIKSESNTSHMYGLIILRLFWYKVLKLYHTLSKYFNIDAYKASKKWNYHSIKAMWADLLEKCL